MIETEQTATIHVGIDKVWDYVQDIARWAAIMPGYQTCEIIDAEQSRWTLKVGVGSLVRTVKVAVTVDEWAGPGTVRFSYKLAGDPVQGGGTYTAIAKGADQTEIALRVQVEGSGPMAPMWEAMGKPLLPQFASAFAQQLKAEIEKACGVAVPATQKAGLFAAIAAWFGKSWRALFGEKKA